MDVYRTSSFSGAFLGGDSDSLGGGRKWSLGQSQPGWWKGVRCLSWSIAQERGLEPDPLVQGLHVIFSEIVSFMYFPQLPCFVTATAWEKKDVYLVSL